MKRLVLQFILVVSFSLVVISFPFAVYGDVCTDRCAGDPDEVECITHCLSSNPINTTEIKPPSGWLTTFNPGGLFPIGGLDFVGATLVPNIINILLFIIFITSLIMLIIGGITWIISRGEKEAMAKAKGTVTYALIGLVLALSSWLILNTIGGFLGIKF